jgi:hypothetical protein
MNATAPLLTDEKRPSSNHSGESHPSEVPEFSNQTRTIIIVTLVAGVLFLVTLGAWIWYGTYQYQNIF